MTVPRRLLELLGCRDAPVQGLDVGHINRTYRVAGLVVQRVNRAVFRDVEGVMENLARVGRAAAGIALAVPRPVDLAGSALWWDESGEPWRAYPEIAGGTHDPPRSDAEAAEVARAVGLLDGALARDDPAAYVEVLPGFHDLAARHDQLRAVTGGDVDDPDVARCESLVDRLLVREEYAAWLETPRRVAHNDAKAANVVVDGSGSAVGIIDLDTVMAGTILCDVGELVRSGTRRSAEDEEDPRPVSPTRVAAILAGFRAGWGAALDPAEEVGMGVAGAVLTLENALRFLADHLAGDPYFAVSWRGQNLARFRAAATQTESLLALR